MRTRKHATGRRRTGRRAPWAGTTVLAVLAATGGGVGIAAATAAPAAHPNVVSGATDVPGRTTFDYTGTFANVASAPAGTAPIEGKAAMVATTRATTTSLVVTGLDAKNTYIADVHDRACFEGDGGDRFLFDPEGPTSPPNAIWLYPIKVDDKGRGSATATSPHPAGIRAKSLLIHLLRAAGAEKDNANPPKLACADLVRVTS